MEIWGLAIFKNKPDTKREAVISTGDPRETGNPRLKREILGERKKFHSLGEATSLSWLVLLKGLDDFGCTSCRCGCFVPVEKIIWIGFHILQGNSCTTGFEMF